MELPAMTASHGGGGAEAVAAVEKEHMFEKVVTPSDVGKLNRLVIPKQHAERYFPLDAAAAASGKGLLLSFEDRTGKPWRFRYSYWNSSQSYVMTKGWSRFVREKRLGAGDTVSFCRGVGEAARGRLFIDWRRRRPDVDVAQAPQALHRLPLPSVPIRPWAYSTYCPGVGPSRHVVLLRPQATSTTARPAAAALLAPVPVRTAASMETARETTTSSKRVRLFGVNLDCPSSEAGEAGTRAAPTARALPQLPPPQPSPSPVKERCSLNLGL